MSPLGFSLFIWLIFGRYSFLINISLAEKRKREFLWAIGKKERKEFSLICSSILLKSLSLESRTCSLTRKAWRLKENRREDLWCWKSSNLKSSRLESNYGYDSWFFMIWYMHDSWFLIILVVKIWFSCKNFKSQFLYAYSGYVISQYYFLA